MKTTNLKGLESHSSRTSRNPLIDKVNTSPIKFELPINDRLPLQSNNTDSERLDRNLQSTNEQ